MTTGRLVIPTAASAPTTTRTRHVLADHAGGGGVTVPVPTRASMAGVGPGLLARADALLDHEGETVVGDAMIAWREGGLTWIRLDIPATRPVLERRADPGALAALPPVADPGTGRFVWAPVDLRSGQVLARAFGGGGLADATVAVEGALALGARMRWPLVVRLVDGSVLFTRPAPRGRIELGGRVR